jgi:hypothetical protein
MRYPDSGDGGSAELDMAHPLTENQIEVVDDDVAEILRRKSYAERVAMISGAHRTMRLLIEGAIRTDHPDWSDEQIRAAVARRMTRGAD